MRRPVAIYHLGKNENAKRACINTTTGYLDIFNYASNYYFDFGCKNDTIAAELIRSPPPTPPANQLETLSVPSSPPKEVENIQYTITTNLRVNGGKIISGTLRNTTTFTIETGAEMKV